MRDLRLADYRGPNHRSGFPLHSLMSSRPLPVVIALSSIFLSPQLLAAFSAIGFEGKIIENIPYSTSTGIPNGVAPGSPFSYTFLSGNNLQSFNDPTRGIVDTDDVGSGSAVPDYYKSSEFGWKLDGYQATNNSQINWDTFDPTFVGNGAATGTDYPGAAVGRQSELGEAFNVNHLFSPATGNLAKAPGLGDQFLDVHGKAGYSSQITLDFYVPLDEIYYVTMAFGGRDAGSNQAKGYYRLMSGLDVIFSGNTGDLPFEAWQPINRASPSEGAVEAVLGLNAGVTQQDWEYFKHDFNVSAGKTYTLQVMLPEELNFDFAMGPRYTNTPGIEILPGHAVPEPSTVLSGVFGALLLAFRRKRN